MQFMDRLLVMIPMLSFLISAFEVSHRSDVINSYHNGVSNFLTHKKWKSGSPDKHAATGARSFKIVLVDFCYTVAMAIKDDIISAFFGSIMFGQMNVTKIK